MDRIFESFRAIIAAIQELAAKVAAKPDVYFATVSSVSGNTAAVVIDGDDGTTPVSLQCTAAANDRVTVVRRGTSLVAISRVGGDGGSGETYTLTKSGDQITLTGSAGDSYSVTDSDTTDLADMTGVLPIAHGGTGKNNAPDAFDALFSVTPLTFTRNTSNTVGVSMNLCVRIGRLCIVSCDGTLSTAGRSAWTDTVLGTVNVTSTAWVYALGRNNSGEIFTAQITTNSNEIVYRTLGKATTENTFRFTLVFVCNEYSGGGGGELPAYTGSYESTPSFAEQVYATANKAMTDDFTVHEIDVQDTDNDAGGVTLSI